MNIGDVFLALRADGATFQAEAVKEAQKAGDAAGATLGSRLGKAASIAAKVGLGALSAGAALATKGLVELDDITAQFTADTGASADEAARAKKAINEMAGRNLQPMREIGTALGKVHTDLGLTGDAAEKTTEDFLHFARVTKRDAAEEVAAFDDILDAWNLTADKSKPIMDALVASHQKYGGVIADDETALRDLAPALRAANQTWEDGLGLINLFKTAGVDASVAVAGITKALGKVKSPEELQRLIADISNTEDPFLRAQKAADLFGSKAGPKLANVLKPGIGSLESFKTSGDSVTGTLDKARDALDSTFGAKTSLMLKGFMSNLISLADGFGPLATGLASLASLGGALGLDKLAVTLSKKMLEVGKDAGQSLIDGAATAVGAAGTIIGNFFASRIENIVDPTKNTILGRLYRSAGSKAATIYLKALMAVDALAGAISSAWARVPGSAVVNRAIARAGALAATAYLKFLILGDAIQKLWQQVGLDSKVPATAAGKAAGLALRLGFLLGIAAIADDVHKMLQGVAVDIHKTLFPDGSPFDDLHPEEWPWPLGPKGAPDWAGGKKDAEAGAKGIADGVATGLSGLDQFAGKATDDIATGLEDGADTVAAAAKTGVVNPIIKQFSKIPAEAAKAVRATPRAVADSLREGQFHVKDAVEAIKDAVKNTLSKTKEIAQLEGFLAGKALAKALHDKRPEVRAEAEAWKAAAEERLWALKNNVPNIAERTGQVYADALESKRAAVRRAAHALVGAASIEFTGVPWRQYGKDGGQEFADGLASKTGAVAKAASLLAHTAANFLEFGSPTREGPFSEKGGPEGWARIGALDWVAGWAKVNPTAVIQRFADAASRALDLGIGSPAIGFAGSSALSAQTMPTLPGQASGVARTVVEGGSPTYITNLHIPANPTRDVFGALDLARRYQQGGFINPKVQPV